MPSEQTRNASLTAELNAAIGAQVASGYYQNASEVVRAALQVLQQSQPASGHLPRSAPWGRHARKA